MHIHQLVEQGAFPNIGAAYDAAARELLECRLNCGPQDDQEGRRHRRTLEAIAEVDAGRYIDHADIVAWVESLPTDRPLPLPQPKT